MKSKPSLPETASEVFNDWPSPSLSNADPNSENTVQDLSKRLPPNSNTDTLNTSGNNNNNNSSSNNNNNNNTNTNNNNNNNVSNNNNNSNHNNNNTLDSNSEFKRMEYTFKMENFVTDALPNTEESTTATDLTHSKNFK